MAFTTRWIAGAAVLVELALVVFAVGLVIAVGAYVGGSENMSVALGRDVMVASDGAVTTSFRASETSFAETAASAQVAQVAERDLEERFGRTASWLSERQVEVVAFDPPVGLEAAAVLLLLLRFSALLAFLWALRQLLRRAREGLVFEDRNVAALRTMALTLVVLAAVSGLGDSLITSWVIDVQGGTERPGIEWSVGTLLAALFLLALSEVWRYGVALQNDVEATV